MMKATWAGLLLWGLFAACSHEAREVREASATVETARKSVALAAAGIPASAADTLSEARRALTRAEVSLGLGNHALAKQEALKADALATEAGRGAESKAERNGSRPAR